MKSNSYIFKDIDKVERDTTLFPASSRFRKRDFEDFQTISHTLISAVFMHTFMTTRRPSTSRRLVPAPAARRRGRPRSRAAHSVYTPYYSGIDIVNPRSNSDNSRATRRSEARAYAGRRRPPRP
ncbi:hypothetical protein EVAR_52720_1 [Eumeta japonica]|uniref:Uncharacterized protein n=1 Tax=Eumeta variegata TaxID=151549 RepID=A0A4C1ZGT8_EUMVA|nr:hypothetical protein EVAR_52720_1 [Eumeta japonica]